jgi:hypothetical protein
VRRLRPRRQTCLVILVVLGVCSRLRLYTVMQFFCILLQMCALSRRCSRYQSNPIFFLIPCFLRAIHKMWPFCFEEQVALQEMHACLHVL